MTPLAILKAARELLSDPARWTQGAYARDGAGKEIAPDSTYAAAFCPIGAIRRVSQEGEERWPAQRLIYRVFDVPITMWADTPGRKHAEILARFDVAILNAECLADS